MTHYITYPNESEWLEARKDYITASDAAALLHAEIKAQGESTYHTPYSLAVDKAGLSQRTFDEDMQRRMWFGQAMEPVIQRYWTEVDPGYPATALPQYTIVTNDAYPRMAATLDFMTTFPDKGVGPLEVKSPGAWMKADWEDQQAPLKFQVQCQIQMAMMGAQKGAIFGLVGGYTPRYIIVERDERIIDTVFQRAQAFWEMLDRGEMPEPEGESQDTDAVNALYPTDSEPDFVGLEEDWNALLEQHDALSEQIKEAEKAKEAIRNKLKATIRDKAGAVTSEYSITWRRSKEPKPKVVVDPEMLTRLDDADIPYNIEQRKAARVLRVVKTNTF